MPFPPFRLQLDDWMWFLLLLLVFFLFFLFFLFLSWFAQRIQAQDLWNALVTKSWLCNRLMSSSLPAALTVY